MRGGADLTPYVPSLVFDWQERFGSERAREIEGTMAFVDLSGFTAMSERLARLGKRGAEDVVEIISSTFTQLLSVAYRMQGSLLKFGGDALLLFFAGEGSAERGCAAVHGMRTMLREVGTIRTEAGVVKLGMSSGLHTGTFHMFLAGSSHQELVVAGPDTSHCVMMEHAAERGEVLISQATASRLPKKHLGASKEGGVLLRSFPEPASIEPGTKPVQTYGIDPARFVPTAVRHHRSVGGFEAEHRTCAVAFVRFEGTDRLLAAEGTAATGERIQALLAGSQEILDDLELTFVTADVDADGGKLMLAAGAPEAHEDDEERMLRAVRAISELDVDLPLRIGVNRGPVFGGDIGPTYRRSYSVMGDTVNTAARVMMHAEPGSILATEPVLARSALRFQTRELPPFGAKGKKHLLTAFEVGEPLGVVAIGSAAGEVVGRDRERKELVAAVSEVIAGKAATLALVAEPGMGRSRLLEEFQDEPWFALIRCDRYEERTPYSALRRALLSVLPGDREDPLATVADELGWRADQLRSILDGSTRVPSKERVDQRVFALQLQDSVFRVLAAVPDGRILIFDDSQWMDEASRGVLEAVAPRLRQLPIGLMFSRRADSAAITTDLSIELGPLSDEDAIRLARASANDPLLPAHARQIADRARGNPAFIRALASSFDPDAGADDLPDTLEASIAARIDALTPDRRAVLRHLSVLGMSFSEDQIPSVVDDPDPLAGLEEILVTEGSEIRFRQALFRDVAYGHLPFRLRGELHARAGSAIESSVADPRRVSSTLSMHFHEARDLERSWRYSTLAADDAFDAYAYADAIHLYRRALAAARSLETVDPSAWSGAWRGLGDSLRFTGRLTEAVRPYAEARRLAKEDRQASARLCLLEGDIRRRLGKPVAAVRWYRRGLRLLETDGLSLDEYKDRVRMLLALGNIRYDQGRLDEAKARFAEARASAEAGGDEAGIALSCMWLQHVSTDLRDGDDSAGQEALSRFRTLGIKHMEAQAASVLAAHARSVGDWAAAVDLYEQSRLTLEDLGDSINASAISNNVGEILGDQGLLEEAASAFQMALDTFEAAGHAWVHPVRSNLAWVVARCGDHERAERLFEQAREGLTSLGATSMVIELDVRRAAHLVLLGRTDEATSMLAGVDVSATPSMQPAFHRVAGTIALLEGDRERSERELSEALDLADRYKDMYESALSAAMLSRAISDPHRARDLLETSAATMQRLGIVSASALPPGTLSGA